MILEYKYLLANLLGLLPLGVLLLLARRLRTTAVICGAILSAYSPPVAWLYEGVYWAPTRVIGTNWGVEDTMFCFHAGAISWLCAVWPWGSRVYLSPIAALAFRRLLVISLCATAVLLSALVAGFTVLTAFLLTQTLSTAVLLAICPQYWRLVVPGAPLFLVYYFLLLGLWRLLIPGFMDMWTGTELGGGKLLGIPVEEYFWVLSFCTGFPITMAFALDVQLERKFTASLKSDPA